MREIALDTETTGLDPQGGHRVIEIGCVELVDKVKTGKVFHTYLNPERDVPDGAFRVHGISTEFLRDKPLFSTVVEEFLAFIGKDILVIHNAVFDLKFLNHELSRQKRQQIPILRAVDTLHLARQKFPGAQATLDALCRRFNIDLSARMKHGALLDAELLADVYIELMGGAQSAMALDAPKQETVPAVTRRSASPFSPQANRKPVRPSRGFLPSEEELAAHAALCRQLKQPLWEQ